ncbi:MAG: TonB family protein [Acidobacteria bacterium]|nr:TonB family protein [Acidobacteriota bacterium]
MYKKGKYDEALALAKQTLEIVGKIEGENSLSYASTLTNIAAIYGKKSKYDDAITFHQRALPLYEKLMGTDSLNILRPLSELAVSYVAKSDYDKAAPLYQRAVAIKEQASSFNNLLGSELLLQYSCVLRKNKKQAEADSMETRALSITLKESADQLSAIYLPGDCLNLKKVKLPFPRYPNAAKAARLSGAVEVELLVDETGQVISARALNGHSQLQGASLEAAYKAKFEPLVVGGRPVKVRGNLKYTFKADVPYP